MNERDLIGAFGWVLVAAGAITLAAAVGGVVAGAIVCMVWGVLFGVMSTL